MLHLNNLSNGFIGLAGTDRATLADWQSVAGSDLRSSTANPKYRTDQNLHVLTTTPTPVESGGSFFSGAINWVAADFDGEARNASLPDIGADEGSFILLARDDLSGSSFVNPVDGGLKIVNQIFAPQATFENSGTASQTNVPVRFRLRGPQPSSAIVYDQVGTIPSIGAGISQSVTFPSAIVSTGGFYTMEAIAQLPGDQNPINDMVTGTVEVAGPLSGTFTVGSSQPAPFNTISNVVARLNTVGVSGPATFLLSDATYWFQETFPIQINSLPGSSPARPVTFKPAPGVTSTIIGGDPRALMVLNGADNIVFDGSNSSGGTTRDLTITNTANATAIFWDRPPRAPTRSRE